MKKKLSLILLLVAILGGIGFMVYQSQGVGTILDAKGVKLYQHGFQLYEEQIATYIKENYSGVSKIEFSPIFISGGDGHTMFTAKVVPVLYDNYGDKAYLGRSIGENDYGGYGLLGGLTVDFDGADEEVIELTDLESGRTIDVSKEKHLPKEARLTYSSKIDENIEALVADRQLKDIKKDQAGSPQAKVSYNTEIKKGEHWKWH
ncbi:hypothetical protein [Streptococcus oricebi]|uniref:Uncharacterized protein n=1 Tax=Streptococcus oricebi TaxID=1547447 RepID=A0ABS5B1L2_9STRE|nr:hypothetical protein [Streptococcus oricebi]MBP2622566.1 hypothetical protein [Streptococcus oricebi]